MGSSHSRTAINEMYGGRSQFAGLVAAILLGVFLLYFTDSQKRADGGAFRHHYRGGP